MPEPKRLLKVFLCHASQDKPIVRELYRRLKSEDWIDTWLDEKKLLPGQDWQLSIKEAVETSDIVLICLSSNSVNKEGFIQKELRYAREIALEKLEESIFLIPLRIDECIVPRSLSSYHWVDFFGEKKDETYNALMESLRLRYEQKLKIEKEKHAHKKKEKLEREAAERIAKEKAEREFTEEVKEKAEREAAEKAKLEFTANPKREKSVFRKKVSILGIVIGSIVEYIGRTIWNFSIIFYVLIRFNLLQTSTLSSTESAAELISIFKTNPLIFSAFFVGSSLFSILGGYICAYIAKHDELLNGTLSSLPYILIGICSLGSNVDDKIFFIASLSTVVISPLLAMFGGFLRLKQKFRKPIRTPA